MQGKSVARNGRRLHFTLLPSAVILDGTAAEGNTRE